MRTVKSLADGSPQVVALAVSSLTQAANAATLTTSVAHGLSTGDRVTVKGAVQPQYNGSYQVTVTSATAFTYTITGNPVSPATGTITTQKVLDPYQYDPFVGVNPVTGRVVVEVGQRAAVVSASVTRPADITAYAFGSVINTGVVTTVPLTFANAGRIAGGTGVIVHAMLADFANQETTLEIPELWLFNQAFTASNDRALWTPSAADLANLVAVIPFEKSFIGNAGVGAAGNIIFQCTEIRRPFKCVAGSQSLSGIIVVRNAYTPISSEQFTAWLKIIQD